MEEILGKEGGRQHCSPHSSMRDCSRRVDRQKRFAADNFNDDFNEEHTKEKT